MHGWSQIARYYLKSFLNCNNEFVFNFDDKIDFPEVNDLSLFHRDVLVSFNKAFVKDKDKFMGGIKEEYLWASRFFVNRETGNSMALFLRNWIRS